MPDIAYHLAKCREQIEKKLAWGSSDSWQSGDFETLSEKILEQTGVLLSSSTLKRVWGKVRYESTPNAATLNALAQFAGHESWRTFTATGFQPEKEKTETPPTPFFKSAFAVLLLASGLVLAILLIGFAVKKQRKALRFEQVQFTSRPVASGLPNTVVFRYDATGSNADSVFIQQSWDSSKRYKVDKHLHEYASTYYYPGYYKAKLVLNDSVVKEHDVYIETEGWLGMIEKAPVPLYLPGRLFENRLGLWPKDLAELNIDFQKEPPLFSLTNVHKSIDVHSSRFSLRTELQNTYDGSNAVCQQTAVLLLGTNGIIGIPLCKPGCVGEIGLMLGTNYVDGKTYDLSGFGVDFSEAVTLFCETRNGQIKISVNGKLVYTGDFSQGIDRIVGMQIKFSGTGVVRSFAMNENK